MKHVSWSARLWIGVTALTVSVVGFTQVGLGFGLEYSLVVFPVVRMVKEGVGYDYFPGMYTALFPMIPAILALLLILDEHRKPIQPPIPAHG